MRRAIVLAMEFDVRSIHGEQRSARQILYFILFGIMVTIEKKFSSPHKQNTVFLLYTYIYLVFFQNGTEGQCSRLDSLSSVAGI